MLLVVQIRGARPVSMNLTVLLAAAAALQTSAIPAPQSAPLPKPLTQVQSRDIGCVASIAILADEQKRGVSGATRFADVQADGRKWAGIAGDRIMFESGQPREVIAYAFREAAKSERRVLRTPPAATKRTSDCIIQMKAELAKESRSK
jgi:hypothetical protein